MRKLGVAVIGTGQWGKNHARVYKELPSTELVAICDVNAERAQAMAKQHGVKAYSDSTKMLKDKSIEAVNVCTWSTILFKEAQKALNAGKHVLVEKPMATIAAASPKARANGRRKWPALNRWLSYALHPRGATNSPIRRGQKNRRTRLRNRQTCLTMARTHRRRRRRQRHSYP